MFNFRGNSHIYQMEKGRIHAGLTRVVWELNAVGLESGGTWYCTNPPAAAPRLLLLLLLLLVLVLVPALMPPPRLQRLPVAGRWLAPNAPWPHACCSGLTARSPWCLPLYADGTGSLIS